MHQNQEILHLGLRFPEIKPRNPCIAQDSARRDPCRNPLLSSQNDALLTSCLATGALATVIVVDASINDCSEVLGNTTLRSCGLS